MALERRRDEDEAFLRDLTLSVEDWPPEWRLKGHTGHRWFRSPNVIPMEKYRRAEPQPQ
jgi:hypothetical protein